MYSIIAKSISKKYHRHAHKGWPLKDVLAALFVPWKRIQESDTFWALRDISFSVKSGEAVGIIGRNGAGKSALLRILQGIAHPTVGHIEVHGSIGSLLEVGAGFHPDLTGRENIFLSGAFLGLSHRQICRRFDEIVSFAGTEAFLDMPVKYYSSGMYVRLGFAVASHCDADILLIDEALAVGDAAFQQQCLRRMRYLSRMGKTIIFVTHDMQRVREFCRRVIVLENGNIVMDGSVEKGVEQYTRILHASVGLSKRNGQEKTGDVVRLMSINTENISGEQISAIHAGEDLIVRVRCNALKPYADMFVGFSIHDESGQSYFRCDTRGSSFVCKGSPGVCDFTCHVPRMPLRAGVYAILGVVGSERNGSFDIFDLQETMAYITVYQKSVYPSGFIDIYSPVIVPYSWEKPTGVQVMKYIYPCPE